MEKLRQYILAGVSIGLVSIIFIASYFMLEPFIAMILDALILAIFLQPFFLFCVGRLKLPKHIAALLTLILFLICILIPIFVIISALVREVTVATSQLPKELSTIANVQIFVNKTLRSYSLPTKEIQPEINQYVLSFFRSTSEYLTGVLSRTGTIFAHIFIIFLTTFYLLVEQERIFTFLESLNPFSPTHYKALRDRTAEVVIASVKGVLAVILMQSALGITGFFLFGISAPTLLGLMFGITSIIPIIGNSLVWVPVALYLYFTKGIIATIALAAWILLGNFIIDHLITPNIIGRATGIHSMIILFGVLGGIHIFGFPGIIIGPTIISLAFAELEIYKAFIKK